MEIVARTTINVRNLFLAGLAALTLVTVSAISSPTPAEGQISTPTPTPPPGGVPNQLLLHKSNLARIGGFQLPSGDNYYSYGATGMGFYNDPSTGKNTLFIAGHDWYQKVGQVDVSGTPGAGGSWASLPLAATLQTPVDVTEGRLGSIVSGCTNKIGGTLPYRNRLIVTGYCFYDATGAQHNSHGASGLDLSTNGDFVGFYPMSDSGNPRSKAGYMGVIPPEWQSEMGGPALTGQCCLSIISATSSGPSVHVFNPDHVGHVNPISGTVLSFYPLSNPIAGGGCAIQSTVFNCATKVTGVAFPQGSNSVLFFGTQGTGVICYKGDVPGCPDNGGYNSTSFRAQVWAYDATELLKVKNGQLKSWQVVPYEVWDISDLVGNHNDVWSAAYDPVEQRVYAAAFGDREQPQVSVLQLSLGRGNPPPPSPTPAQPRP